MAADSTPDSAAQKAVAPASWDTEEGLLKACDYVFQNVKKTEGHSGVGGAPRRRVMYSRPKHLVELLMKKEGKGRPEVDTIEQAMALCEALVAAGHLHRAIKEPKSEGTKKNLLMVCAPKHQTFTLRDKETRYTWVYEGKKLFSNVMTTLLILAFLAITCFPIWPRDAKVGIWYCSVTLLGLFAILTFVRLVVAIFAWLAGWEFWIFPRLFDDSEPSFFASFKPMYTLKRDENQSSSLRIFAVIAIAGFTGWVYSQPTEFDHFIVGARQFTEDLYEGKLLPERSQQEKDDIDKVKMPSLDELMKEQEENLFESGEDEDEIVDRFMDEKFFGKDSEDGAEDGDEQEGEDGAEDGDEQEGKDGAEDGRDAAELEGEGKDDGAGGEQGEGQSNAGAAESGGTEDAKDDEL